MFIQYLKIMFRRLLSNFSVSRGLLSIVFASNVKDQNPRFLDKIYDDIYDTSNADIKNRFNPVITRDPSYHHNIKRKVIPRPKPFGMSVRSAEDRKAIVSDLIEYGFSVIQILSGLEADQYQDEFIDIMKRNGGLINSVGLTPIPTHSQFMWD